MKDDPTLPESAAEDSPGVPGFRSWRGVYVFVFLFFVLCVALLALLSRVFR
jgi:hypothetical protein